MSGFNWLHLSDLHLKTDVDYDVFHVLGGLLEWLEAGEYPDQFRPIHAIFFTGDIAFSGKEEQYQEARKFLEHLQKITGVSSECIFVVPGNHDVERQATPPGLQLQIANANACAKAFESPETTGFLNERFTAFREFASDYANAEWSIASPYLATAVWVDGNNHCVGIIGLNTAWLCPQDAKDPQADKEQLVLSEQLFDLAMRRVNERSPAVTFALLHHPLNWLHEFERKVIENKLRDDVGGVDVLLTGHEHSKDVMQSIAPAGSVLSLSAGALHDDSEYRKTVTLGRWNADEANFTLLPMVFQPAQGREQWVPDTGLLGRKEVLGPFKQRRRQTSPHRPLNEVYRRRVHVKGGVRKFDGSTAAPTAYVHIKANKKVLEKIARVEYEHTAGPERYNGYVWNNKARNDRFSQTWGWEGKATITPTVFFTDGTKCRKRPIEVDL